MIASANQALAFATGKENHGCTVHIPDAIDVRAIRAKVDMSQSEFAKSAYETLVADSQKIAGLYGDLAKQAFKPIEGLVARFTPSAR